MSRALLIFLLFLQIAGQVSAAGRHSKKRESSSTSSLRLRKRGVGFTFEARLCSSILSEFDRCEEKAKKEIEFRLQKAANSSSASTSRGVPPLASSSSGAAAAASNAKGGGAVGPVVPLSGERICPKSKGPHELFIRLCEADLSFYESENKYVYGVDKSSPEELETQCGKLEMMYRQAEEDAELTLPPKVPGGPRPVDTQVFCRAVSHLDFSSYDLSGYSAEPLPETRPGDPQDAAEETSSWLAALKRTLR